MRRSSFGIRLGAGLLTMMLLLVVGCAGGTSTGGANDPIKLGIMVPLSGPAADHGPLMVDGAKLAIEEINQKGGVLGRKLELVVWDDATNTEKGITGAKKMIEEDKVFLLMGVYRTGVAQGVMEVAADYKVPFLITMASSSEITDAIRKDQKRYRYVWRPGPDVPEYTVNIVAWLQNIVKARNYYYVGENTDWSKVLRETLLKQAKAAGIEEVATNYVDPAATDFTSTILDVKQKNPDAVVSSIITSAAVPFVKQYYDNKVPAPIAFTSGVMTIPATVKTMGAQADFVAFSAFNMKAPATEKTVPFWEKFEKTYGRQGTGFNEVRSYDTVYILADALQRAGKVDREKFIDALADTKLTLVTGTYTFNKETHQVVLGQGLISGFVAQWQDGKPVILWPEKAKNGDAKKHSWWK